MTLLSICQNAANNVGVGAPSSIISSTDPGAVRLLQMARRTARSLALKANWVALTAEYVFIANGTSDYTLPSDYRSLVADTLWDRSRYWQMRGALSPQDWQAYKSSVAGAASIERRWRIRIPSGGVAGEAAVFSIDPAIGSTDTSSQFVFEYVSKNWCRSATTYSLEGITIGATGSAYVANDTLTLAGGTFTTAATIRVVSVTAGAITAAEVLNPGVYTARPTSPASVTGGTGTGATFAISTTTMPGQTLADWAADTDTALLDEDLIELGVIWRLQQRLGLAYAEEKDEYEREVDKAIARDGGTATLSLTPVDRMQFLGPWNVPETGFGT